jgi:hypothetical protein
MLRFDPKGSPISIPYLSPKNQTKNLIFSLGFAILMLILVQLGAIYSKVIIPKNPSDNPRVEDSSNGGGERNVRFFFVLKYA